MINAFNNMPVSEMEKHMRLTTKQVKALKDNQNKIKRFFDIFKIDGIGMDTYKSLFRLFYFNENHGDEQLSLF